MVAPFEGVGRKAWAYVNKSIYQPVKTVTNRRIHEPLCLIDRILHHGKVHVEHADLSLEVSMPGKGIKGEEFDDIRFQDGHG